MTKTAVTFASLNAVQACATPYEFEYIDPKGNETGLFLQVLGGDSDVVKEASNKLSDSHRKREAIRAAEATRPGDEVTPKAVIDALGQQLAAVRLVGWRGMDLDHTPELALQLCQQNSHLAETVMTKSNQLGNFPGGSSKTS